MWHVQNCCGLVCIWLDGCEHHATALGNVLTLLQHTADIALTTCAPVSFDSYTWWLHADHLSDLVLSALDTMVLHAQSLACLQVFYQLSLPSKTVLLHVEQLCPNWGMSKLLANKLAWGFLSSVLMSLVCCAS